MMDWFGGLVPPGLRRSISISSSTPSQSDSGSVSPQKLNKNTNLSKKDVKDIDYSPQVGVNRDKTNKFTKTFSNSKQLIINLTVENDDAEVDDPFDLCPKRVQAVQRNNLSPSSTNNDPFGLATSASSRNNSYSSWIGRAWRCSRCTLENKSGVGEIIFK